MPVAAHCAWEEASRCVHSKALGWREDGAGIALRRNATQRAHRKHPPCLSTGRLLGRRCENGKLPLAARGAVGSGQDTRFARLCHRRGSRVRRRRADSYDDFRAPEEKTRRLLIRDMAQLGRTAASEGGLTWPDGPIVENTYRRAGRARTRSVVDSGWWCVAAWQVAKAFGGLRTGMAWDGSWIWGIDGSFGVRNRHPFPVIRSARKRKRGKASFPPQLCRDLLKPAGP